SNSNYPDVEYYGGYYSRYFKAVVEEYCRKPFFLREEIYFRDYIETIQHAVESGKLLRADIVNHSDVTNIESWDIRPFKLMPDVSHMYHYLIGKTVPAGGLRRDEIIASFRLSRIRKMYIINNKTTRNGNLSSAEKKEIREKIHKRSVSFLIGEECDIQVRFTESGKQQYKIILFMRPPLSYVDSKGDYHFLCTKEQAKRYFIRFGKDAEIIAPKDLRQYFAETYIEAARIYR
ncbi:MAG: WYL domain-containing protein, partial [Lachnospiraceae bacterium]|nr:WYL domain-containing protein [Lachnospiraceae bacterium]